MGNVVDVIGEYIERNRNHDFDHTSLVESGGPILRRDMIIP